MRAMTSNEQLVLRDYPLGVWLFGLVFLAAGMGIPMETSGHVLMSLAGLIVVGFVSVLSISLDRGRGVLNLHYRSLFRVARRAYRLEEICSVDIAEDIEGEGMYRIELTLRSGQVIPLRSWYKGFKRSNQRQAQRLRSALGLNAEMRRSRV